MEGGNGEGVEWGNSVFYRFRYVCVVECVCQFRSHSHMDMFTCQMTCVGV